MTLRMSKIMNPTSQIFDILDVPMACEDEKVIPIQSGNRPKDISNQNKDTLREWSELRAEVKRQL